MNPYAMRSLFCGLVVLLSLSGCSNPARLATLEPLMGEPGWRTAQRQWVLSPAYYAQAVSGHLGVLSRAKPIDDWLADSDVSEALKDRLKRAQAMRRFAADVLDLPDNSSYTRYADLERRAVVWNVVATPALSLEPHKWCFPFAGCVSYRGFYQQQAAQSFAASLSTDWDVKIYPVSAYSTLGWTQWLGGDPLLNTMLAFPEMELAELLFHELAHQRVYVSGDTTFSESYATAVERLGVAAWRAHRESDPDFGEVWAKHQEWLQQRKAFLALVSRTRVNLQTVYSQAISGAGPELLQPRKADVLLDFERQYAQLKNDWGGMARFDVWGQSPNNAVFAIQNSYEQWVPAFEQLHTQLGGDWRAFHAAVQELSRLPREQREIRLKVLQTGR